MNNPTIANPRNVALKVLRKIETDASYSGIALNNALKNAELSRQDASFVTGLVYGVLEKQIFLDRVIGKYSKLKIEKLHAETLIILRMGIYQLLFMDKVPQSAAVNESVKLAMSRQLYSSKGFINAVLRTVSRSGLSAEDFLPKTAGEAERLSIKYSCPEKIVGLWLEKYGSEITEGVLKTLSGRPPLTARVNTLRTSIDEVLGSLRDNGVTVERIPFLSAGIEIFNTGSIEMLPSFKNGEIYIQDAAAQLCCELVGLLPGETMIDVCAAPGGKSLTCAQISQGKAEITACDIFEHKLTTVNENAERLGIPLKTQIRNAAETHEKEQEYNKVLCDVPCSGLGILRRKPEIRYKNDILDNNLPLLQYAILENSAKCVAKGGTLIYATCTLNPAENGEIAERFLKENPEFSPLELDLPDSVVRLISEPKNQITLFPQANNTDGFFIAKFLRGTK